LAEGVPNPTAEGSQPVPTEGSADAAVAACLASYTMPAMPVLNLSPDMAHTHQPIMSPLHHEWDGNGAAAVPTLTPPGSEAGSGVQLGGRRWCSAWRGLLRCVSLGLVPMLEKNKF